MTGGSPRFPVVCAFLLAVALVWTPAYATHQITDTREPVVYDGSLVPSNIVNGTINNSVFPVDPYDWYCFNVSAGVTVTLTMNRTSGSLYPNLTIYQGVVAGGSPVSMLGTPLTQFPENLSQTTYTVSYTPAFSGPVTLLASTCCSANGTYSLVLTSGGQAGASCPMTPGALARGQIVSGITDSTNNRWLYYTILVPAGARDLSISTSLGSGDVDLFARAAEFPTWSAGWDVSSARLGTNNEAITVPNPLPGVWYIGLLTTSPYANVSLVATFKGQNFRFADFDGDGSSDVTIFRNSGGSWFSRRSGGTTEIVSDFGSGSGDVPVPGDYDGDGKADRAIFRPFGGSWFIQQSGGGGTRVVSDWGSIGGDIPVPSDYDGDGKVDVAIFRPSEGGWYIQQSTGGTRVVRAWGSESGDMPVPADYDGDGKTDLAIFRPASGGWFIQMSGGGIFTKTDWGAANGDVPVPADYDGDSKADLAIFRPSNGGWYIIQSGGGIRTVTDWGSAHGDRPIPLDFDGDGKVDLTIFRPRGGYWYILQSGGGIRTISDWGSLSGDLPIPRILTSIFGTLADPIDSTW